MARKKPAPTFGEVFGDEPVKTRKKKGAKKAKAAGRKFPKARY